MKNISPQDEKNPDRYRKDYAEFIDIAAHDLDAPLRKVSLLIDRLVQKNESEELKNYYDRIQSNLSEMRSLIDKLTTWAGFTSDSLSMEYCNLEEILTATVMLLRQKHPSKNIKTEWRELPLVMGDRSQLTQLFRHILTNSVIYNTSESVEIKIDAGLPGDSEREKNKLENGVTYFRISIADNGIGFDEEHAENIFRPFTRLHGKSEFPGTGMGLAISKKIMENHGGIIYGESKQNNGATITLILPQSH